MTLGEVLEETKERYPKKIALLYKGEETSFKELNSIVNKFAHLLQRIGVKRGDRVAVILNNSLEFVLSHYAIFKLGAIAVPLNPSFKEEELKYLLKDSKAQTVILKSPLTKILKRLKEALPDLKNIIITDLPRGARLQIGQLRRPPLPRTPRGARSLYFWEEIKREKRVGFALKKIRPTDPAVIIYTSGVTSLPKGALLTHKNLIFCAQSSIKAGAVSKEDTFLTVIPLFHAYALTVCMNIPILLGARSLILESFIPQKVIQAIKKYKVTLFPGVPTMFAYLLNTPGIRKKDLQSLRFCLSGAMPLDSQILKSWEEKFAIPILEGYGPTEAGPVASLNPLKGQKLGSVGVPIPGVSIKIVDEKGVEFPVGKVGEVIISGPNVMKGYLNQSATKKALKKGWFYTGDLGKKDQEGYLYLVGRKKEMIIVGGFKVYPKEVEEVLLKHPQIIEAAVVGVQDQYKGESVKAFIVLEPEGELSHEETINFLKERLADYKIPRYLEFRKELPKTELGKILKREL